MTLALKSYLNPFLLYTTKWTNMVTGMNMRQGTVLILNHFTNTSYQVNQHGDWHEHETRHSTDLKSLYEHVVANQELENETYF